MEIASDWVLRYTAEKWPLVRAELQWGLASGLVRHSGFE